MAFPAFSQGRWRAEPLAFRRMTPYPCAMSTPLSPVLDAAAALRGLFEPTPLLRNDHLSARYGAEIWLKREDLTPVRSYKLRGAFNAMRRAGAGPGAHFVCASAGNHAQGMAYACRHFGSRGTIFMPVTTPIRLSSCT